MHVLLRLQMGQTPPKSLVSYHTRPYHKTQTDGQRSSSASGGLQDETPPNHSRDKRPVNGRDATRRYGAGHQHIPWGS